jgi:hypothetical protein
MECNDSESLRTLNDGRATNLLVTDTAGSRIQTSCVKKSDTADISTAISVYACVASAHNHEARGHSCAALLVLHCPGARRHARSGRRCAATRTRSSGRARDRRRVARADGSFPCRCHVGGGARQRGRGHSPHIAPCEAGEQAEAWIDKIGARGRVCRDARAARARMGPVQHGTAEACPTSCGVGTVSEWDWHDADRQFGCAADANPSPRSAWYFHARCATFVIAHGGSLRLCRGVRADPRESRCIRA